MAWKIFTHCILFWIFTSSAWAQALIVRSGDHEGFSRLVFRVPDDSQWTLENNAQNATIQISDFSEGFDVSRVFDLIGKRYISNINTTLNELSISFSCECIAEAYQQQNGFIVIDVSDYKTEDNLESFKKSPRDAMRLNNRKLRFRGIEGSLNSSPLFTFSEPETQSVQKNPVPPTVQDSNSLASVLLDHSMELNQEGSSLNLLKRSHQDLANQIAKASTQGLLNANNYTFTEQESIDTGAVDVVDQSLSHDGVEVGAKTPEMINNLRVTTSMDFPNDFKAPESSPASSGLQCLPDEKIELEVWGSDEPMAAQVAELREDLYSDLDRLNHDVAKRLSKLYLHFGFGAEARQVLEITNDLLNSAPVLMEISEIMEFGFSKNPTHLPAFQECDGDVALWAILSQKSVPTTSAVNTSAALRALGALPIHLRRFIAPELSRRLLNYGDEDGAAAALRSVSRRDEPLSGSGQLARAELEMSSGATDAARSTLASVVTSNEQHSAEALIKFVDSHLAADTQIDESVATLVEAYAFEMRNDPLGSELRRTYILALAKSGQFDASFREFNRRSIQQGDLENEDELRHTVINIMTETAPDVVFLENFFSDIVSNGPITNITTVKNVVNRLVELGFASEADSLIANSTGIDNTASLKIIRAKIALQLGRPSEAQAILFGVETPKANALKAIAKLQSADFDGARELFTKQGESNLSLISALMAEDWQYLSEQGTGAYSALAELSEHTIETDNENEGMLGRATSFVSESQNARQIVGDLLTEQSNVE